jgi:hypothetical protein
MAYFPVSHFFRAISHSKNALGRIRVDKRVTASLTKHTTAVAIVASHLPDSVGETLPVDVGEKHRFGLFFERYVYRNLLIVYTG